MVLINSETFTFIEARLLLLLCSDVEEQKTETLMALLIMKWR